jgi:hypothetical protein
MLPLITALLPMVGEVLDRVIPDKAAADKAKLEMQVKLMDAANQGALAQVELNKVEAASSGIFKGGWRPFIGWVCGAALAYQFIVRPILPWLVNVFGGHVPPMPGLDDMLWELVFAMLGLGALRSADKKMGTAR